MTKLIDIDGRQVFVVLCATRDPIVVGVCDNTKAAKKMVRDFIKQSPDPEWEDYTGERANNTYIVPHFINMLPAEAVTE